VEIIPRSVWGARHDDGFAPAPLPAQECWLHHSVTPAPDPVPPFDEDFAAVRTLEQIGEDRFGGGISYTWLIAPSGLVFQGHSVNRQGAHTAGRNDRARAICFVGNYEVSVPTAMQIRSAAWLLQQAEAHGWLREARLNGGHRDVSSTACPGRHAYAAIAEINQLAAGPPITTEDNDMQLTELVQYRVQHPDGALRSLYDSSWQTRADLMKIAAEQVRQTALLTTLAGRDPSVPLDTDQLVERLNANIDDELARLAEQLRADAAAAREQDRAAMLELVRTELGDAVADELAARFAA
jgi:hypothetical protein